DQAVIAIENARLFDEVQARTRELTESLQQQTATSEVLQVISRSPGELEPVFDSMLENAIRICEANCGNLFLYEKGSFRIVAMRNAPAAYREQWQRHPVIVARDSQLPLARLAGTKEVLQITDLTAERSYLERDPRVVALVDSGGLRSMLLVPMLKEADLIGAIVIYRQEVRPFTEKQIELLSNFAAQAVIGIENPRLLNELRESLQQQTATSEVLRVISSSSANLQPVFETILSNATRLCDASFGTINLYEGDKFRIAAVQNLPPPFAVRHLSSEITARPGSGHARVLETKDVVHIRDVRETAPYREGDPAVVAISDVGGARSLLLVPMMREQELVGVITIFRQEVLPFTEQHIELIRGFAKQAVIAIENTRLLNELRESLQQQTATADVLKVI